MAPLREHALPAANRIFVDRDTPQRVFESAAFSIPNDRAIIRVFYGVGGQGKTSLCRELMRKTGAAGDPGFSFLRRALVDLHDKVKTEPDLLLVWIRNSFAECDISSPCFDLALALMWEGKRGEQAFPTLTKPWLGRSTSAAKEAAGEGASGAADWLHGDTAKALLGDALAEIPFAGLILKRLGSWAIDKAKKTYLLRTREPLKKLYHNGDFLPAYEIAKLLPWMLAQDLNYHLERHATDRFVLFVDEYERVFDQGGAGAVWKENEFDRHMRSLIQNANGLLAVFFSRERLPWEELRDWRDDLKGNQHLLGGLGDQDAEDFLKAIPIQDPALRKAIINGAREMPASDAPVYPFMLDLQVEHWRNLEASNQASPDCFEVAAETFADRRVELVERVLRDYGAPLQTTIERLSVARRFDRAAFECMVSAFHTAVPLDSFDSVAGLSFVTRAPDGFLVFHNVVRTAIREQLDAEKRQASIDMLLLHFSERARVGSHFELNESKVAALFETAYLRRQRGFDGYVAWLAKVVEPLRIGAYYSVLEALWREALFFVEPTLGPDHPDTAASYNNVAWNLDAQGRLGEAEPLFRKALEIRERVLGPDHPDTAASYNNEACNLDAQGRLGEAEPLYRKALEICERVLGPDHPNTIVIRGNFSCLRGKQKS